MQSRHNSVATKHEQEKLDFIARDRRYSEDDHAAARADLAITPQTSRHNRQTPDITPSTSCSIERQADLVLDLAQRHDRAGLTNARQIK